jgi:hypothetical protein
VVLTRRPRPECIGQHPEAEDEAIPHAAVIALLLRFTLRSRQVGKEWILTMCASIASSSCLSEQHGWSCVDQMRCVGYQSSALMSLDSFVFVQGRVEGRAGLVLAPLFVPSS